MAATPSTLGLHLNVLHNRGRRRSSVSSAAGSHHGGAKSALKPLRLDEFGSSKDQVSARAQALGIPPPLSGRFSSAEAKQLREAYLHRLDVLDTIRGVELLLQDISIQVPPSDLDRALELAHVEQDGFDMLRHVLTENEFYTLIAIVSLAAREEPSVEDQEREALIDVLLQLQGDNSVTPRPTSVSALDQARAKHDRSEVIAARVAVPALDQVMRNFSLNADLSAATGLKPQQSSFISSPVSNAKNAPPPPPPPPPTFGIYDLATTLCVTEEVQEVRRKAQEAAAVAAQRLHDERHVLMPGAQGAGGFAAYHANREKTLRRKAARLNVDALVNGQSMNRRPTRGSSMVSEASMRRQTVLQSMAKLRRGITSTSTSQIDRSSEDALSRANTRRSVAVESDADSASARASVRLPSLKPPDSHRASPEFGLTMEPTATFELAKEESLQLGDIPSYDSVIRSRSVGLYGAKRRSPRPWHVPKAETPDPETAARLAKEQKRRIRAARMPQKVKIGITDEELDAELRRRHLGPYRPEAAFGDVVDGPTPRQGTAQSQASSKLPRLPALANIMPPKALAQNGSFGQYSASDELTSARSQLRSFRADVSGVMDPAGLSSRREVVASLFNNAVTPERRAVIDRWLATERQ